MRYSLLLLALLIFAGCSDKVPLHGTVTFSDGTPLEKGTVIFETPTYMSRGAIKKDGKYAVSSEGNADGIPKGTYNVCIVGTENEDAEGKLIPVIDPKFGNGSTSGLTFVADGKQQEFNITIEKPAGK